MIRLDLTLVVRVGCLVILLVLLGGVSLDAAVVYGICFCVAAPFLAMSWACLFGRVKINVPNFRWALVSVWMTIALIHSARLYQSSKEVELTPIERMSEVTRVASGMLIPTTLILLGQALRQRFAKKKE